MSVRYKGRRFTLTPEKARVAVDIDGSVDRAMAVSTDGNLFTRTWREVRGRELDARVEAQIDYSEDAVRSIVRRVERRLEIEARDASVDLESGKVDPTPEREGLDVRAARLRKDIRSELVDMGDTRIARVETRVVEPKVTTKDLAEKYPAVILINRGGFQLSLYKNLKLAKTYPIAVGQVGLETPAGLYNIENKAVNPAWHVPNSDWAGSLAGTVVPPRPLEPDQGALDGHLRRRRHPRDRRHRLDRHQRLARLRPHADPGRGRALRPGARGGAGLHRLNRSGAIRARRDSDPRPTSAAVQEGGVVVGVAKTEGADEDARSHLLAHHRVPHGRGVSGSLDAVPGQLRRLVRLRDARLHELALCRHLTRGGVDEEHGHGGPG